MAQALVQVRMDFVGDGAPFLGQFNFLFVVGKLLQGAGGQLLCCIVIGMGDIGDGDALGTMLLTNPVRIGQVDADGRGRIAVAGQAHGIDNLGADALHGGFLEARVHRRVVLEPLGVGTQDFRALGSLEVLDVHVAFPGSLAAQRVIVVLDETVDEVHRADGILHPLDVEFIPLAQVAGFIIVDENGQRALLDVVFRHLTGFGQFFADFLQGGGVQAPNLPGQFRYLAFLIFHHFGVEPPGNRFRVCRVNDAGVIFFHFLARDIFIIVNGGKFHQVSGGFRGPALRPYGRIVNNVQQAFVFYATGVQQGGEILLRTSREDFVLRIMVVDAVGEEYPFGIDQKILIFSCFRINGCVLQNGFQRMADAQVVFAVLVPEDVPAVLGGFCQVIGVFFLLQAQVFPARNAVAHDFQVCEGINRVLEIMSAALRLGRIAAGHQKGGTSAKKHFYYILHNVQIYKNNH